MALDKAKTTNNAMQKLIDKGFVIDNEHSEQLPLVAAIVEAIIEDINADAQVVVSGGSSSGTYQVK